MAIVGLGGTGAYILDLIAKTPIGEIHLYDGDRFYAHNAFRAPGAASADELDALPFKVEYFRQRYDPLRRHIIAHQEHITEVNVGALASMSFVFIAIEAGSAKKVIVDALEPANIPFIDVGLGVEETEHGLTGLVRLTTSVPGKREEARKQLDFQDPPEDAYDRNIQIVELNALNAVLAVIKWKKIFGFYADYEHELNSAYVVARNRITNDDREQ